MQLQSGDAETSLSAPLLRHAKPGSLNGTAGSDLSAGTRRRKPSRASSRPGRGPRDHAHGPKLGKTARINMSRIAALSKPDAWYLAGGFGSLVLAATASSFIPHFTGSVIDKAR